MHCFFADPQLFVHFCILCLTKYTGTGTGTGFDLVRKLNDSESFAQALFYNHQKVCRCSQNIQSTNTKFSMTDIISGGLKNYMCLPKINRAYQTRVVEVDAEPERTLLKKMPAGS